MNKIILVGSGIGELEENDGDSSGDHVIGESETFYFSNSFHSFHVQSGQNGAAAALVVDLTPHSRDGQDVLTMTT